MAHLIAFNVVFLLVLSIISRLAVYGENSLWPEKRIGLQNPTNVDNAKTSLNQTEETKASYSPYQL